MIHFTTPSTASLLHSRARIVQYWQCLNPGFAIVIHNDSECRAELLRDHGTFGIMLVRAYDAVPKWSMPIRSDIWRVAFLYHHGGVYVDDDVEPLVPLERMTLPSDQLLTSSSRLRGFLNPHFLVVRPRHPLLMETLHKMLASMEASGMRPDLPYARFMPVKSSAMKGSDAAAARVRGGEPREVEQVNASTLGDREWLYGNWSVCNNMAKVFAAHLLLARPTPQNGSSRDGVTVGGAPSTDETPLPSHPSLHTSPLLVHSGRLTLRRRDTPPFTPLPSHPSLTPSLHVHSAWRTLRRRAPLHGHASRRHPTARRG